MAEEYVPYDKYRADLADFRSDMAHFREEMRTEVGELRTELRTGMAELRTELRTGMAELRTEMHTGFAGVDVRMAQFEVRLMRWMLLAAGVGGIGGGLVAAAFRLFSATPGG